MNEQVYVLIMAGGRGERFWPLSTPSLPKPFLKIIDGKSLIELTYERAKKIVPQNRIFFVIGEEHKKPLLQTIPGLGEESVISEPEGRDTAACIGYSALLMEDQEDPVIVVFPADHYIGREDIFRRAIFKAIDLAKEGSHLVTFGIKPDRPETGYGYIKVGEVIKWDDFPIFKVERFVEKPDLKKAMEYLESGDYYWNSGMFVWRKSVILNEMGKYLPDLLEGLKECISALRAKDTQRFRESYSRLERISIDYGVMEKSENVFMVRGDFFWDDIGTWSSIIRIMGKDEDSNVILGNPYIKDVKGSLILSEEKNVGVLGLEGVIVVATKNGILVCSKEYAQHVREIARYFSSK